MIWHVKYTTQGGSENWMVYPCPKPTFTSDKVSARPFGSREEATVELLKLRFLYPHARGKLSVETDKE